MLFVQYLWIISTMVTENSLRQLRTEVKVLSCNRSAPLTPAVSPTASSILTPTRTVWPFHAYTRTTLFFLRTPRPPAHSCCQLLTTLKEHGLLSYRGKRGGRNLQRSIRVLKGHRPPPIQPVKVQRHSLTIVLCHDALPNSLFAIPRTIDTSPPTLYLFNASSVVKPHSQCHPKYRRGGRAPAEY